MEAFLKSPEGKLSGPFNFVADQLPDNAVLVSTIPGATAGDFLLAGVLLTKAAVQAEIASLVTPSWAKLILRKLYEL